MHININSLKKGIDRSKLLSPNRKESLHAALAHLNPDGLSALADLLAKEPERIATAMKHVIGRAVLEGNSEWIKQLELYLQDARRSLSRKTEGATKDDESIVLEHFFDDTL